MPALKDLTGKRFGRWTVLGRGDAPKEWGASWTCRCDCGTVVVVQGQSLRDGRSKSCGCLMKDLVTARSTKHGRASTPEYTAYHNMLRRCYSHNHPEYHRYGARGITVCDAWRGSFEAFLKDMGERPSPGHSLNRLDNSRGYDPDNCAWSTLLEQSNNTRKNVYLLYDGRKQTLPQWAREFGVTVKLVAGRLDSGWSLERALTTPKMTRPPKATD